LFVLVCFGLYFSYINCFYKKRWKICFPLTQLDSNNGSHCPEKKKLAFRGLPINEPADKIQTIADIFLNNIFNILEKQRPLIQD